MVFALFVTRKSVKADYVSIPEYWPVYPALDRQKQNRGDWAGDGWQLLGVEFLSAVFYAYRLHFPDPVFNCIMKHNLRISIVMVTLFTLLFGVGGKVYLCLSPHGDVHIKQNHASDHTTSALTKKCPAPAPASTLDHHREKCQSHCQDIALGGDKAEFPGKYSPELPALAPMPLAMSFLPTPTKIFSPLPAVQLPQFALRQSVILLI